jgi:hypothetical protein
MKHHIYTPENITNLEQNEIFVFGSNLAGKHNGGGAKIALEKFGATYGNGVGIQGQSYAIPTLDENFDKLKIEKINSYVKGFIFYAIQNPNLLFLVTKIGCGIAGYSFKDMAQLFIPINQSLKNIILPKEFIEA